MYILCYRFILLVAFAFPLCFPFSGKYISAMAKLEQPIFVQPKKRVNGKRVGVVTGYVDHIIMVQGADVDISHKIKNGLSPVQEQVNGMIHSTMEGLKSNMKINLPMIADEYDEENAECEKDAESTQFIQKAPNPHKNGFQSSNVNLYNGRDIVDLSPIYENSSDACSSHDDLRNRSDENLDVQKSCKVLNVDCNDGSSTANSLSETSLEMATVSEKSESRGTGHKNRKKVNIVAVETDEVIETEVTMLQEESERTLSPDYSTLEKTKDNYLTMNGTIKRGKKKGHNIDVKLNISREELEVLEAAIVAKEHNKINNLLKCSFFNGPHILIWCIICIPIIMVVSGLYSFYTGTLTWYNIFIYITEVKNFFKKVFLSPIVILLYPFFIFIFTLGLSIYSGIAQMTFNGHNWWKEVCDLEKGFYGWLCGVFRLSDCSPYEVVILTEIKLNEGGEMIRTESQQLKD